MRELNEKEFRFFLNKLKNDEPFSYLNYGDGEWSFIYDRKSNSSREIYSDEARKELWEALKLAELPNVYLTSFEENCPEATEIILNKFRRNKELVDGRLYYEMVLDLSHGDEVALKMIKELIKTLNERHLVFIGEKALKDIKLKYDHYIISRNPGATDKNHLDMVEKKILDYGEHGKPMIYSFCMGVASNIMIKRLHGKLKNAFLIDFGSLWNFIYGLGSRCEPKWRSVYQKLGLWDL